MTTTNGGGSQGRIVEHRDGIVERVNERGVKLATDPDYKNFSKYADPPIAAPRRGARVRLGLDASGFVRQLEVLDSPTEAPNSSDRDRVITRLTCIKIAGHVIGQFAQTHEEVRTEHIFPLADRILAWIDQEDES